MSKRSYPGSREVEDVGTSYNKILEIFNEILTDLDVITSIELEPDSEENNEANQNQKEKEKQKEKDSETRNSDLKLNKLQCEVEFQPLFKKKFKQMEEVANRVDTTFDQLNTILLVAKRKLEAKVAKG